MYPRMFTGKFTTLKIHVTNALLYLKVPAVPLVCTYHLLIYVCTFVCLFTLQLPVYRISISIITESSNLISFKRFPRSFKCASTLVQFLQFYVAGSWSPRVLHFTCVLCFYIPTNFTTPNTCATVVATKFCCGVVSTGNSIFILWNLDSFCFARLLLFDKDVSCCCCCCSENRSFSN